MYLDCLSYEDQTIQDNVKQIISLSKFFKIVIRKILKNVEKLLFNLCTKTFFPPTPRKKRNIYFHIESNLFIMENLNHHFTSEIN